MLSRKQLVISLVVFIAIASGPMTIARWPVSVTSASQSGALAVLNDRTITLDDLDPRLREMVNGLDGEIQAARARILSEQIDIQLFQTEASRRRISVIQLLAIEVKRRTLEPTQEDIQAIYDANRAQFGTTDINGARAQIVAYLRRERTIKLSSDLAMGLRKRYPVVMGVNINSPNLAPTAVLVTVAGRALLAGPIIEQLKPIIYDLQHRVYEAVSNAVEQMINDLLVIDEARRKGVGPEVVIRTEITEKQRPTSETEIAKFYEENKARITGDFETARNSIVAYLDQQKRTSLEQALRDRLRTGVNIRILLSEPAQPVIAVSVDDDPSRGPVTAPVTVVVFTDFQCPVCGANHPIINEVTSSYGSKVRLVIRDFPLEMHENAQKAAEAANAANAQGKFFEYMELLFKNQKALDIPSLKKYASEIGLNRVKFDAALDAGAFEPEVSHDIDDGLKYGVAGTPTVFVNGVRVNVLSAETLRAEIDKALGPKKAS